MSVWLVIGAVAVIAAVLAAVATRIDADGDTSLGWLAHDFGPGDGATARKAAFRVSLPLAALSVVVTIAGLVVSGGASWSGVTSFVGLLLAGVAMLGGATAGRRAMRRDGESTGTR
jgi:hypothetical protein